jgi:glycosyltransferase involved in cell wall biosynthesis
LKVSIVTNMAPFVWGGAEELAVNLHRELGLAGADVELMRIPFAWEPSDRLVDEVAFCKQLEIRNADLVIAMKFPAYHVRSHKKKIWLIHQYRQAYDFYDNGHTNIPNSASGDSVRKLIVDEDNALFRATGRVFTISEEVSQRLLRYNGVSSETMRAPLNDPFLFTGGEPCGYILAAGRVNAAKRQSLLVEAMRHLPPSAKLIVAGPPDSPADAEDLRSRVRRNGLEDRVKLDLRFLSRQELATYVNEANAIAYLPFMEDSYGYVTMEAFEARKPVITTTDSGEVQILVMDGVTGRVCNPGPEELAQAMSQLLENPDMAHRLGLEAHAFWRGKDINWSRHIERLLS